MRREQNAFVFYRVSKEYVQRYFQLMSLFDRIHQPVDCFISFRASLNQSIKENLRENVHPYPCCHWSKNPPPPKRRVKTPNVQRKTTERAETRRVNPTDPKPFRSCEVHPTRYPYHLGKSDVLGISRQSIGCAYFVVNERY